MNAVPSGSQDSPDIQAGQGGGSQPHAGEGIPERFPPPASASSGAPRLSNRRQTWLAVVVAGVAILDQITKLAVVKSIPYGDKRPVIPGVFSLVHFRNPGAAWGMLRDHTAVLAVISALVFAFIVWQIHRLAEGFPERAMALALILGGIAGNLADRIARGEVVDFIYVYYRDFRWPAFNVADSAICCGVALFVASSLFRDTHDGHREDDHRNEPANP